MSLSPHRSHSALRPAALWIATACLAGCVSPAPDAAAQVLIFGEQHDQPDQQRQVADTVRLLAAQGRLGAVVIEMAEQGRSSLGQPLDAQDVSVQTALAWAGWPWEVYGPVVMAAVRAGVPVLGGNLARARLIEAAADDSLDARLEQPQRERIAEAVRRGHCGLLPQAQEPAMVRIQIARDLAMAQTVHEALGRFPGRQVLLLTGAQHASLDRGVPVHLARLDARRQVRVVMFGPPDDNLRADELRSAETTLQPDPCAAFATRLRSKPSAASSVAADGGAPTAQPPGVAPR